MKEYVTREEVWFMLLEEAKKAVSATTKAFITLAVKNHHTEVIQTGCRDPKKGVKSPLLNIFQDVLTDNGNESQLKSLLSRNIGMFTDLECCMDSLRLREGSNKPLNMPEATLIRYHM